MKYMEKPYRRHLHPYILKKGASILSKFSKAILHLWESFSGKPADKSGPSISQNEKALKEEEERIKVLDKTVMNCKKIAYNTNSETAFQPFQNNKKLILPTSYIAQAKAVIKAKQVKSKEKVYQIQKQPERNIKINIQTKYDPFLEDEGFYSPNAMSPVVTPKNKKTSQPDSQMGSMTESATPDEKFKQNDLNDQENDQNGTIDSNIAQVEPILNKKEEQTETMDIIVQDKVKDYFDSSIPTVKLEEQKIPEAQLFLVGNLNSNISNATIEMEEKKQEIFIQLQPQPQPENFYCVPLQVNPIGYTAPIVVNNCFPIQNTQKDWGKIVSFRKMIFL